MGIRSCVNSLLGDSDDLFEVELFPQFSYICHPAGFRDCLAMLPDLGGRLESPSTASCADLIASSRSANTRCSSICRQARVRDCLAVLLGLGGLLWSCIDSLLRESDGLVEVVNYSSHRVSITKPISSTIQPLWPVWVAFPSLVDGLL